MLRLILSLLNRHQRFSKKSLMKAKPSWKKVFFAQDGYLEEHIDDCDLEVDMMDDI